MVDDGGPAFPLPLPPKAPFQEYGRTGKAGMTLRDWFAGQVLVGSYQAACANANHAARNAYRLADAMLAARKSDG